MKRKLLAVLITLVFAIGFIVPVFASPGGGTAPYPPIVPAPTSIQIPFLSFCTCYDDAYCDYCNED